MYIKLRMGVNFFNTHAYMATKLSSPVVCKTNIQHKYFILHIIIMLKVHPQQVCESAFKIHAKSVQDFYFTYSHALAIGLQTFRDILQTTRLS